ncbi:Neuropeptide FF receptor 2 [Dermatophagoides pteronyssinus]|uniref:Neuropeptide FF receptor 2 n=1 Tax=Dermatophagoides pteronyssinus TaxID=6956 RepID=A0ABQ8J0X3_DERPT|nr:Neuropeptide FF receptor 2 [Dermatophagoides pteronyssinus]
MSLFADNNNNHSLILHPLSSSSSSSQSLFDWQSSSSSLVDLIDNNQTESTISSLMNINCSFNELTSSASASASASSSPTTIILSTFSACNLRYSLSWTIILIIAYLIVFLFGLFGNISVLWIVWMLKRENKCRQSGVAITTTAFNYNNPNQFNNGEQKNYNGNNHHSYTKDNSSCTNLHRLNVQTTTTTITTANNRINLSPNPSFNSHNNYNNNNNSSGGSTPQYHHQTVYYQSSVPLITINRSNQVFYRFVCNLALADLLVVLFCLIPTLIGNIYLPWVLGRSVCKAVPYLQGVSVNASVYTLVAISIDRFYAIYYPLSKKCSTVMCWTTIILIWLFSMIISFPWIVYFDVITINVGNDYSTTTTTTTLTTTTASAATSTNSNGPSIMTTSATTTTIPLAIETETETDIAGKTTSAALDIMVSIFETSANKFSDDYNHHNHHHHSYHHHKHLNPHPHLHHHNHHQHHPNDNQNQEKISASFICGDQWPSTGMANAHFLIVNLGLQYLIPLSIIALFYILILKKIAERKLPKLARHLPSNIKDGNRQSSLVIERSKVKVFKMLIVLVLLFALSWLPLYVIFFILKIGPQIDEQSIFMQILQDSVPIAQWLGASNSCVNPILYFFFNAKFRSYYRTTWLKTFNCLPIIRYRHPRTGSGSSINSCAGGSSNGGGGGNNGGEKKLLLSVNDNQMIIDKNLTSSMIILNNNDHHHDHHHQSLQHSSSTLNLPMSAITAV